EILVTFSDGSTTTITSDDDYITYNGEEYLVYIEQLEPTVTEGENVFVVDVLGTQAEFVVNVVSNEEENTTENEEEETTITEPNKDEEEKDVVEDKDDKEEEKEETTVKPSTDKEKEDKDDKEDDKIAENKNPVIPNTDGGVSVVATAVIALASGFGIALIPSKKEK
ncbi:MAG: hypothetical protein IKW45_07115, partial [Clostridia bacterium]|nr:hypothetical protein [Clostridia bacterium]